MLRWADELGFSEAWIGEHHTAPWAASRAGPCSSPALLQTKRMRIGPGGFLMPYHHPAELANRVAMLDHLAQGRLNWRGGQRAASDWACSTSTACRGTAR
jgi:alkanesulfonate monooxygenase SsuD/methylene tetrahydromethanopterin reductase-like flavin-dependent oxidoreductase (luciferase family)